MRNCIRDRRSAIGEDSLAKPPAPVYPQMHPSSQAGPSLLQERIVTQADVIGAPEPAAAGGMMSFFQRAATGAAGGGAGGAGARGDMYALRDRAGLLAQMEAPPLILHVAESEGKRFPYEVCVGGGGGGGLVLCFLCGAVLQLSRFLAGQVATGLGGGWLRHSAGLPAIALTRAFS